MYSGMQEVDGKLYSPMAAIIDGKRTDATEIGAWMGADERPDLVKGGKFQLVKTDKNPGAGERVPVLPTILICILPLRLMNDQFTGAYARGNIKVVEWEIPESEKTSGYHAEGERILLDLFLGILVAVNGLLPRIDSRSVNVVSLEKAVRVVPEVLRLLRALLSSSEGYRAGSSLGTWLLLTTVRELVKLGVPITTVSRDSRLLRQRRSLWLRWRS